MKTNHANDARIAKAAGYGFWGATAVMSLMALNAENGVINPALNEIGAMFPDIPSGLVSLMSTLPSLTMLPFSIIAGMIAGKKVKYKTLALIGLALATISNILCFFIQSFAAILVFRGIFGIGFGLITALGNPLIVQGYQGNRRTFIMGIGTAFWYGGSVLFYLLAGVVAAYNPMATFLIYAIGVIPFVLVLFFLPEPPKKGSDVAAEKASAVKDGNKKKLAIPKDVIILALSLFIMGVAFCPFLIGMSSVIAEKGLGDSSFSGIVLAANSVGGILAGIAMQPYVHIFKRYSLPVTYLALCISLVLLYFAQNAVLVLAISIFAGFFFALPVSICNLTLGNMVGSERVALLSNVLFVMFNFGSFMCSFWITALGFIVPGMSLVLLAGAAVMAVLAVVIGLMKGRGMLIGHPAEGDVAI